MAKTIAYTMSRFPKLTETFILYEILEIQRLGVKVEVFPLLRETDTIKHAEAEAIAEHTHYTRVLSWAVFVAQFYWLLKRPATYFRLWAEATWGHRESPKFMSRAMITLPLAAYFARRMQALGVEHVHAHYATHPAFAAYVVHQLAGIPYSITAHAHDLYVDRTFLRKKLEAADTVITISDFNRQLIAEHYGAKSADKTVVIHCGVDPEIFQPRKTPTASGTFTIICVASLQDYKGQTYLIEACKQLRAANENFQCWLIGEGENRPQLEQQIADAQLGEQVQLLGAQPRHRVQELLQQANVMVMPSIITDSGKMEGIPVALMEALVMEIPVIVSRISGIPELVVHEETGLLVPQKDAVALANAIQRVMQNPEATYQMAQQGRQRVLAEFNLLTNSNRVYRELFED